MPNNAPFFSNDAEGLMKVAGFLATLIAACWAFLWRALDGPQKKKNEKQAEDINNVGRRVNDVETRLTQDREQIFELKARLQNTETITKNLAEGFVELRTRLDHIHEVSVTNKIEIIAAFQGMKEEVVNRVHALDKEVAIVRDRKEQE